MAALVYNPAERVREKQRSREADRAALAKGQKSQADLVRENSFIRASRAPLDFSRVPSVRNLRKKSA